MAWLAQASLLGLLVLGDPRMASGSSRAFKLPYRIIFTRCSANCRLFDWTLGSSG